jgi:hypothetical protein
MPDPRADPAVHDPVNGKEAAVTRSMSILATAGAALLLAAPAGSSAGATLVIRHQTRGCHAWSLNGGPYEASQRVALPRDSTLVVVDNDVMAHKLVRTSGPAVTMRKTGTTGMMDVSHEFKGPGVMAHMGAAVAVTFAKAGTYRFTTKAGEDYMKGMKTIGEDNVLRLAVVVR